MLMHILSVAHAGRYICNEIPARRFAYLPLGPRLKRLFGTSNLAQIVQAHHGCDNDDDDVMFDIHDSPIWCESYSKNGMFNGDKRGLSFGLCTDGVNPYAHNRVLFHVANCSHSAFLVGIIPGNGSKEAAHIDPYLNVLVDEMLSLTTSVFYDAYSKAPFDLKVRVLSYVLDYPGIGKIFKTYGSGAYKACLWCEIQDNIITVQCVLRIKVLWCGI